MPFIATTDNERDEMLKKTGVAAFEDLIADIPRELRLKEPLDLPAALSEPAVMQLMEQIASNNVTTASHVSYLGGGGV